MKGWFQIMRTDFRLIFRDPSLLSFLAFPLLIFGVVNILVPFLIGRFPVVEAYVPFILMWASVQVGQMFGIIYGLVFIDEKDTQVAKAYGVLPVSKGLFMVSRLMLAFLLSGLVTVLLLLTQPFYHFTWPFIGGYALWASLLTVIYPLLLTVWSANKLVGMTWAKVINLALIIPVAAFFVPEQLSGLFALLPPYWAFRAMADHLFGHTFWFSLLVGFVPLLALLGWAVRRIEREHFR